jgi:hypothetical protein
MTTHLPHSKTQDLPPLENGDRLTRPEFERRYAAAPHITKAELIEGIVYVASPLRHEQLCSLMTIPYFNYGITLLPTTYSLSVPCSLLCLSFNIISACISRVMG